MGMLICPKCKKELIEISGTNYIDVKCKDCNRLVIFNPETGIKMKKIYRTTSSGVRFY